MIYPRLIKTTHECLFNRKNTTTTTEKDPEK